MADFKSVTQDLANFCRELKELGFFPVDKAGEAEDACAKGKPDVVEHLETFEANATVDGDVFPVGFTCTEESTDQAEYNRCIATHLIQTAAFRRFGDMVKTEILGAIKGEPDPSSGSGLLDGILGSGGRTDEPTSPARTSDGGGLLAADPGSAADRADGGEVRADTASREAIPTSPEKGVIHDILDYTFEFEFGVKLLIDSPMGFKVKGIDFKMWEYDAMGGDSTNAFDGFVPSFAARVNFLNIDLGQLDIALKAGLSYMFHGIQLGDHSRELRYIVPTDNPKRNGMETTAGYHRAYTEVGAEVAPLDWISLEALLGLGVVVPDIAGEASVGTPERAQLDKFYRPHFSLQFQLGLNFKLSSWLYLSLGGFVGKDFMTAKRVLDSGLEEEIVSSPEVFGGAQLMFKLRF